MKSALIILTLLLSSPTGFAALGRADPDIGESMAEASRRLDWVEREITEINAQLKIPDRTSTIFCIPNNVATTWTREEIAKQVLSGLKKVTSQFSVSTSDQLCLIVNKMADCR